MHGIRSYSGRLVRGSAEIMEGCVTHRPPPAEKDRVCVCVWKAGGGGHATLHRLRELG